MGKYVDLNIEKSSLNMKSSVEFDYVSLHPMLWKATGSRCCLLNNMLVSNRGGRRLMDDSYLGSDRGIRRL